MDFYELMAAAESLRGDSDTIDLSSGSPLVFEELSRIVLDELAAPRWINAATLGGYADYDGVPAFTELICARWSSTFGRALRPAEVMVTPGAQGALTLLRQWLAESGRRILYPLGVEYPGAVTHQDPASGVYESVRLGDGVCRVVLPNPEALDWRRVGAVILSQPHNPTTVAFTAQELQPLLSAARQHDAVTVFDRSYALPGAPMALDLPALPPEAVHIFSFSKVGLASERTGVLIGPEEVVAQLRAVQRRMFIQAPKIGQALAAGLLDGLVAESASGALVGRAYRRRWDGLAAAMKETAGDVFADGKLLLHVWQGGPFLWAELHARTDIWEFAESCLRAGVIIMPGASLAVRPEVLPAPAFRLGLGKPTSVLIEAGVRLGRVLRAKPHRRGTSDEPRGTCDSATLDPTIVDGQEVEP
ncbi:pyridoxal phosphate-dependent aminotransferase [Frankia sp. Mgl5]|uniref:pyridoxal phosphate-dependent aminotransferase n=1 Tax=Frankia sp. Mgl5 TaxID=2933793 RepID=UPI00200BCB37|nr:pyridoxal phosphate-dependent aminotransferase [Frankia sp. Mgl5]MCK9931989.1 pyridoxal phosphate-dependent aminotransferase [Frankia sp. Mgl5]